MSNLFRGTEFDIRSKKFVDILQALRDCGVEEVINLPKIAVIGNQSAGKSSLIEAISQVKLPRASGTCTRCPMEVILHRGDPEAPDQWNCKVSLRFEHDEGIQKQKFGTFEFGKTTEKETVPLLLRRAQLAILNPGDDIGNYKDLSEAQCKEISKALMRFSRNTVVLEITGAEVDVTFVDLPGIIAGTENVINRIQSSTNEQEEQSHFIDLIRDLAVSYVSQEECFILVTISMKGTLYYLIA
jgi:vacuolar protein sorting-associated protein 1